MLDCEKVKIWIRIVRNYLEEDDSIIVEIYFNKFKNVMYKVGDMDLEMMFYFKLSVVWI